MQTAKLERPKPLSEIAADYIRRAIIQGEYKLGENLTESALSEQMGISKTPIREALATLKREGFLQGISQKGTHVFTLTAEELLQLYDYRYTLEAAALDIAAKRDNKALCQRLESICAEMETARAPEHFNDYLRLDTEFHDAFFICSGNKYLHDGYSSVGDKIATLRTHLSRKPLRVEKSFAEHVEITRLIARDEPENAKAILREHIDRGQNAYDELLISPAGKGK